VIGSAQDLESASLEDVKRFFGRWYNASNVSIAIVGDVDPGKAKELVQKYFGWMPKAPVPDRKKVAEVRHDREQRVVLQDQVELPRLTVAWVSPPSFKPGDAEMDLFAQVLARGRASRLYKKLVHELQIASDVSASQDSLELQSVFRIDASVRPGHTAQEVQGAIDGEVKQLLEGGPTEAEMAAARIAYYTGYSRLVEGLLARAELMSRYLMYFGDPNAVEKDLGRYEAATAQSVLETARKVLGPGRVIVEVQPSRKGGTR
jgi:zinc protease